MKLTFTFAEKDALAFTEKYLRGSKSHQQLRTKVRAGFPVLMIFMACYHTWKYGFSGFLPVIFGVPALAWWFLYPKRFDARVRAEAKKQMGESSYAKSLGPYEVTLLDEHLASTSPTGSSTFLWTAVDRVEMDADYVFIFLSGPTGYPIRKADVGEEAAQRAYDFVAARIAETRVLELSAPLPS